MADYKRAKWAAWADNIKSLDNPARNFEKPEALDDLVVIDLSSRSMAGCFCSSMLSELGAETIRIEPPGGDLVRTYSPNGIMVKDTGLAYLQEGRNKYHITLNLETEEGRDILKSLVAQADVLIETYPAGTMEKWGIGYEALSEINPRLIFASISTFGQFGPEFQRDAVAFEGLLDGVQ